MTDLQLPTVNGMREGEGEGGRGKEEVRGEGGGGGGGGGRKGARGKEGCYNITILYHDIVPGV